jgi:hypothetical protein
VGPARPRPSAGPLWQEICKRDVRFQQLLDFCNNRIGCGTLPSVTDAWVRWLLRREGLSAQCIRTWKRSHDPQFDRKKTDPAHFGVLKRCTLANADDPSHAVRRRRVYRYLRDRHRRVGTATHHVAGIRRFRVNELGPHQVLKESCSQLWDYRSEAWARKFLTLSDRSHEKSGLRSLHHPRGLTGGAQRVFGESATFCTNLTFTPNTRGNSP